MRRQSVSEPRARFKDWRDYLHLAYGVLCGILSQHVPIASLAMSIAYIIYQLKEEEPLQETYFDLVEWITGFVLGIQIATCG